MVFGTNTSVGLKVGTDVAQVPGIQVGYNRQEAVILPLVANVNETTATGVNNARLNRLVPCDVGAPVIVEGDDDGFPVHPCLLVATRGDATDSYSVLASFGAEFSANQGTGVSAGGGLAQYFATGMAAQVLALTGGASVVNSKATPPSDGVAEAAAEQFGTADQRARGVVFVNQYGTFKTRLATLISSETSDATMLTRLKNFEARIGALAKLSDDCATEADCLSILGNPSENPFSNLFRARADELNAALDQWTTPIP